MQANGSAQPQRIPEVTLSLPIALGLLVLFLAVGGAITYFGWAPPNKQAAATSLPLPIQSPTDSPTPTDTQIVTLPPSATVQPPSEYTVALGDTCGGIAVHYDISVQSLIILNNLPVSCNNLTVGRKLKIPYPTATPLPPPTSTLEPADATKAACNQVSYTVQQNDTLSTIAENYGIAQQVLKRFNELETDSVVIGRTILIPLCLDSSSLEEAWPSAVPPPYPAPKLLLPSDGQAFTSGDGVIPLQWASLGALRENEAYEVVVQDVTAGQDRLLVDYVTDTRYIIPATFRPQDTVPHLLRWWALLVRQSGSDEQGQPSWASAGDTSEPRDFTWMGATEQGSAP